MVLHKYQNGNTYVSIHSDGTKVIESNAIFPKADFPNSMDLKITNYCSLSNYCKWCHENSNTSGSHADINYLLERLKGMPEGIELAIGGGNPLDHPELLLFLEKVKSMGYISNITVNQLHIKKHFDLIVELLNKDLIKGLGISYNGNNIEHTKKLIELTDNIVFHLIIGINDLNDLKIIKDTYNYDKVLLLGYKQFRKGKKYFSEKVEFNIKQWYMRLPIFFEKMLISFDNLAIDQLNLRRYFTEKSWNQFFMGHDGQFTYYIDGVSKKFAVNSTSEKTFDLGGMNIKESFSMIK